MKYMIVFLVFLIIACTPVADEIITSELNDEEKIEIQDEVVEEGVVEDIEEMEDILEIVEEEVCPTTCDDMEVCTLDYCNEDTDFKCEFRKLEGPQPGCTGKKADNDCYEYLCINGGCFEKYFAGCCGNEICETLAGETYENCVDCPYYDAEGDLYNEGQMDINYVR